jgi:hypothetical protein
LRKGVEVAKNGPESGALRVILTADKTHSLSWRILQAKAGDTVGGHEMNTTGIGKHIATILAIFAVIFFMGGCGL